MATTNFTISKTAFANKTIRICFLSVLALFSSFTLAVDEAKPALYIIGDSTVKNGSGKGEDSLWGWGDFIASYLDTNRIHVENHARGGRSSRTYQTEGLWDKVLEKLKPGDFVFIQFGHNDGGSLNKERARGSLKGVGEEKEEVILEATGKPEVVYTYGWYMRKYIRDAKAKGAIPVVFSLVPRNIWKEGKVERSTNSYAQWAAEVAKAEGAFFIDLHEMVAKKYEGIGEEKVKADFFPKDHTHTNEAGAKLNAQSVIEGLRERKDSPLNTYLASAKKKEKKRK